MRSAPEWAAVTRHGAVATHRGASVVRRSAVALVIALMPQGVAASVDAPLALAYSVTATSISLNGNDPPFMAEFSLPRVSGGTANLEGSFNRAADRHALSLVGAVMQVAAEAIDLPGVPITSGLWITHEVRGLTERAVSVRLDVSLYAAGAAHPGSASFPLNFDARTGRELFLADVFRPGADYLRVLSSNARTALARREVLFFTEGVEPRDENFRSWYITPGGLEIVFDAYQVAPYALGPQTVVVSWRVLRAILRPGGPAG